MKTAIASALASWGARRLDLIVHVGAGVGGELEAYAALGPARAVLVEGDPETAAVLREAAEPHAWAQVVECVVSATAIEVDWYRYNVPGLNGTADASSMRAVFPGLRVLGMPTRTSRALGELLDGLLPRAGAASAALVVDVFEFDARLLAQAGPERLSRFDAIVLRRCVRAGADGAAAALQSTLESAGFVQTALAGTDLTEAMWPVQLWAFDRAAFENRALSVRLAQAGADLQRLEAAQLAATIHLQEVQSGATAAQAALVGQVDELKKALEAAREARAREAASHGAALGDAAIGLSAVEARATAVRAELVGQVDELKRALETARQAHAREVASLEAARSDAAIGLSAVQARAAAVRAELVGQVDELKRALEAAREAHAREVAGHEAARSNATIELSAVEARAAAVRAELAGQVDELKRVLEAAREAHAREVAGHEAAVQRLAEELETERQARARDAAEHVALRSDASIRAHALAARTASAQEALHRQIETLTGEIESERRARADEAAEHEALRSDAAARLQTAEARAQAAQSQSTAMSEQADRASRQLVETEGLLAEARARGDELARQQHSSDEQLHEIRPRLAALASAHETAAAELVQLQSRLAQVTEARDALAAKSAQLHEQVGQWGIEREKLVSLAEARLAKIESLNAAQLHVEQRRAQVADRVGALEREVAEKSAAIGNLGEQVQQGQSRLAGLEAAHQAVATQLAQQLVETRRVADAKDELLAKATESQARVGQLSAEREKLIALAEARLTKSDSLATALAAAERSVAELRQSLDKRTAAATGLDKALAEKTADNERLGQEGLRQAGASQKLQQQLDQLAAARSALEAEVEKLRHGVKEHDRVRGDLERLAQDRQVKIGLQLQRVNQLERQVEAADLRERLLRDEVIQAEAQIDLIKDVLLREREL